LPDLLDWFIQAGTAAMAATAETRSAFELAAPATIFWPAAKATNLLDGGAGLDTYLVGGRQRQH